MLSIRISFTFLFLLQLNSIAWSQKIWENHSKQFKKAVPKDIPELIAVNPLSYIDNDTSRFSHPVMYDTAPYYLSKYEITNKEFCKFLNVDSIGNNTAVVTDIIQLNNEACKIVKEDGRFVPVRGYENYPVTLVSWYGARYYCEWLTSYVNLQLEQKNVYRLPNFRLPSEFEWVYAAANKKLDSVPMTVCDSIGLTIYKTSLDKIKNVKLGAISEEHIYGLNDNVFEWTEDNYDPRIMILIDWSRASLFYESLPEAVIRKHGFKYHKDLKNNCGREGRSKDGFYSDTGFRIAMTRLGRSTGYEF